MDEARVVLETQRLTVRRFTFDDVEFVVRLLNDPSFLANVGDKGVRTLEDARAYLLKGPLASYAKHGFGPSVVVEREAKVPIGVCGLLKRDVLDDFDIGYAFLPEYRGRGFAIEAAGAVLEHARGVLGLTRVVAVVNANNQRSLRLLEKLGFRYERKVRLTDDGQELHLLAFVA